MSNFVVESTDGVGCWGGRPRIVITLLVVDSRGSTLLHAFKSSPHPAVRRVCRQLCCSCRVASFFFTSRQRTNYADKTGSTDCTVHSLLVLLNRSKQVPFRDFRFAYSSQSVQNLSDPNYTRTNSFDRINSAARTRSIELKFDKTRPQCLERAPRASTAQQVSQWHLSRKNISSS